MKLILRPQVERELDEAANWYEDQQSGLRRRFLEAVDETIARIVENPFLYQAVYLDVRRASLSRFPYCVFYLVLRSEIHVIGVVHDSRDPSTWQSRRSSVGS